MSAFPELLKEIRSRPGMYIGSPSVTKLASFLRGYDHAVWKLKQRSDPFLAEFRDWLHERYGCNTRAWEDLILSDNADEAEAFHSFWELLDEYLKTRESSPVNGDEMNAETADGKPQAMTPT